MKDGPLSAKNTKDTRTDGQGVTKTPFSGTGASAPPSSSSRSSLSSCFLSFFPSLSSFSSLPSSCSSCPSWKLAFFGVLLLWASLPPLDWGALAWIAPVPWVLLIRREKIDGRRPYRMLWLAGFTLWMGTLQFLRLPHWATSFGWVALSAYFAFYVPAFVGLSRVAVHRLRVPVMLAAPIVWTGLELVRAHLLTGMSMASLGHTQYRWIELIQFSDLVGAYGVGFLIMFVAAALARMCPCENRGWTLWPIAPALALVAAALGYGYYRTSGDYTSPGPTVALIQGSIDIEIFDDADPKVQQRRYDERRSNMFREYLNLSAEAMHSRRHIDLLVWPESMFPWGIVTYDPKTPRPPVFETDEEFHARLMELVEEGPTRMANLADGFNVPLLLGTNATHLGADRERSYASAVYVGRDGKIRDRYDKIHLVMFGEYMPFVESCPWLQNFTPLTGNAAPGERFVSIDVGGFRAAPSICYENVLSHFIRRQVNSLAADGKEPDLLINLTNDGWFWGSNELDLHLMCAVFRAVECRKPFLVAANTGFSANIDGDGRIVQQGPRRAKDALVVQPRIDQRRSLYLKYGDWFAGICLAACALFAGVGLYGRIRPKS